MDRLAGVQAGRKSHSQHESKSETEHIQLGQQCERDGLIEASAAAGCLLHLFTL